MCADVQLAVHMIRAEFPARRSRDPCLLLHVGVLKCEACRYYVTLLGGTVTLLQGYRGMFR